MRFTQHVLDFNRRLLHGFSIIFDHKKVTLNNASKGSKKNSDFKFYNFVLKGRKKMTERKIKISLRVMEKSLYEKIFLI